MNEWFYFILQNYFTSTETTVTVIDEIRTIGILKCLLVLPYMIILILDYKCEKKKKEEPES
jgi:hypothetical protein